MSRVRATARVTMRNARPAYKIINGTHQDVVFYASDPEAAETLDLDSYTFVEFCPDDQFARLARPSGVIATVTIPVELRAFTQPPGYPTERPVEVPLADWMAASTAERLDLVFYYGQNDHQPSRTCYSVSMGDVIRLPGGRRYRVAGVGFERLPDERRD